MEDNKLVVAGLRAYIESKEEFLRRYGFRTLPPDRKIIEGEIADAKALLNRFNNEEVRVVSDV